MASGGLYMKFKLDLGNNLTDFCLFCCLSLSIGQGNNSKHLSWYLAIYIVTLQSLIIPKNCVSFLFFFFRVFSMPLKVYGSVLIPCGHVWTRPLHTTDYFSAHAQFSSYFTRSMPCRTPQPTQIHNNAYFNIVFKQFVPLSLFHSSTQLKWYHQLICDVDIFYAFVTNIHLFIVKIVTLCIEMMRIKVFFFVYCFHYCHCYCCCCLIHQFYSFQITKNIFVYFSSIHFVTLVLVQTTSK